MSDKDALQKLTEAGEIQAALERIATLEAALHLAFAKMDRARDILTDGKPRTDCNWGMLATEAIKHGLGWPIDRAALAGNPAPHLTDAETEKLRAEAAAYKWAYEYLQSRMNSIDRNGWAHDCDGEIEYRIAAKVMGE